MSNNIVKENFVKFGTYIYYLGILSLISIAISLLKLFVRLPYVSVVISIVEFIIIIMMISTINILYNNVRNEYFDEFSQKYKVGFISRIIGTILLNISNTIYGFSIAGLLNAFLLLFIAGILLIAGGILEYMAWNNLEMFFATTSNQFPQDIGYEAREGAGNLKNAMICIFLFFFIITILIAIILQIIGYLKLGGALKRLESSEIKQNQTEEPTFSQGKESTPDKLTQPKFCPSCGSKIEVKVKFCSKCGEILDKIM